MASRVQPSDQAVGLLLADRSNVDTKDSGTEGDNNPEANTMAKKAQAMMDCVKSAAKR